MKIYWSIKSIPEMEGLSKHLRQAAWWYAHKRVYRHWQTYLALVFVAAAAGFGSYHFDAFGAMLAGGFGGFVYGHIVTTLSRPYITEYRNVHKV